MHTSTQNLVVFLNKLAEVKKIPFYNDHQKKNECMGNTNDIPNRKGNPKMYRDSQKTLRNHSNWGGGDDKLKTPQLPT